MSHPITVLSAVILGMVEGATEFLPISSTGHLIAVGSFLNCQDDKAKLFEVVIQLGAILAVCWEYRMRLWQSLASLPHASVARKFWFNLGLAFLPAAVVGLLAHRIIKAYLFNSWTVACALVAGALVIFLVERRRQPARVTTVQNMSWREALLVGMAQIFAMIPGTSRSGATIIGGMIFGLSRQTATEFSFFLAIPTMFAATLFDLYKNKGLLDRQDLGTLAIGFFMAFIVALAAVKWLIRYVATHDFRGFAWYRLGLGLLLFLLLFLGYIH